MSKVVAKNFVPKRVVSLKDYSRHSSKEYSPQAGDIVIMMKNMMVTEHVLSSGFHVIQAIYIGLTWTDTQYTLIWKPIMNDNTAFYGDLRDFSPIGYPKGWRMIMECYNHSFQLKRDYSPENMPCKLDNLRKYIDINIHTMDWVLAKDIAHEPRP